MPQAYHRLFYQVVSKCALRVQKRKAPGFPEALQRTKQDRYRFCKR